MLASITEQRRIAIGLRAAGRYGDAESPLLAAIETATSVFGDDDATRRTPCCATTSPSPTNTPTPVHRGGNAVLACPPPDSKAALGPDTPSSLPSGTTSGHPPRPGRPRRRRTFARRGLTITTAALGDEHLTVATDRAALAAIVGDRGDDDDAEQIPLHQAARRDHQPARRRPLRGRRRPPQSGGDRLPPRRLRRRRGTRPTQRRAARRQPRRRPPRTGVNAEQPRRHPHRPTPPRRRRLPPIAVHSPSSPTAWTRTTIRHSTAIRTGLAALDGRPEDAPTLGRCTSIRLTLHIGARQQSPTRSQLGHGSRDAPARPRTGCTVRGVRAVQATQPPRRVGHDGPSR